MASGDLRHQTAAHIEAVCLHALVGFRKEHFGVRNAYSLLFGTIIRRIFGAQLANRMSSGTTLGQFATRLV